jgi:hypothetical protein
MSDTEAPKTMSVPAAGFKYYGLCRISSYEAAKRGDLPVIKVGRLLRVPVAAMERKMLEAGQKPTEARSK